jgi:ComF family protein
MDLLNLVFPKTCLGCGKEGKYICDECLGKSRLAEPICSHCKRASRNGETHPDCSEKEGLDGLTSIWEYDGVIRKAILSLKYKYSTKVGEELSNHFASGVERSNIGQFVLKASTLVPIPLHWHRENTRGFNQSIEVGRVLTAKMGWVFEPNLLVRRKTTIPQVELSGDKRRQNLKDVFSVVPSKETINTSYIIFDDVFTTGSTMCEAAETLRRAGAARVWGLTIAR